MSSAAGSKRDGWPLYRRLLGYSKRYWPILLLALIGMVVEAFAAGAFTYLMKPMVDETMVARNPEVRWTLPLAIVAVFVLRGIATFGSDVGMAQVGRNVVRDLRRELHGRMLRLPSPRFDQEATASLVSRLNYDAEQVRSASTEALKCIVTDTVTIIVLLSAMLYYNWKVTLIALAMAPVIGLITGYVSKRYRRLSHSLQLNAGDMSVRAEQSLAAHQEVKLANAYAIEEAAYAEVTERSNRLNQKIEVTKGASSSTVQLMAAIALALILLVAGIEAAHDRMTPGDFVALMIAMMTLLPSLKRITTVQSQLARGLSAAERIFDLLDEPVEVTQGSAPTARARGEVEFRSVGLRYADDQPAVLQEVSFKATPGTVTAIVGRSGSGKTSLVRLLPRFYEPSTGQVMLDGVDLRELALDHLRDQIALVGQKVMLFDASIADNIAYGLPPGRASRDEVLRAARAANVMEFAERLPDGIDTVISSNGGSLSGGQRQRIAIARAVLKDAPILILDEATSALDNESERWIRDALDSLIPNRTTLIIAHRLSTIEHADRILVLDQGRLVEQGSHSALIAQDGIYATLHRLQFRESA